MGANRDRSRRAARRPRRQHGAKHGIGRVTGLEGFKTAFDGAQFGFGTRSLVKDFSPFDKVLAVEPFPPSHDLGEVQTLTAEMARISKRPDPDLLRALIEETQQSNQQNDRIIEQNQELLREARENSDSAGRASKWAVIAGITGIVSAIAAVVAIVVTIAVAH